MITTHAMVGEKNQNGQDDLSEDINLIPDVFAGLPEFFKHLTLEDREVFCELSFGDDKQFLLMQKHFAEELAKHYETQGGAEYLKDKAKGFRKAAQKFQNKLDGVPEKESFFFEDLKDWFTSSYYDAKKASKKGKFSLWFYKWSTANAIWLQGWFTSTRLFILRVNRMATVGTKTIPLLKAFLTFGGLSYFLSFAADVLIILFETLRPFFQYLFGYEVTRKDNEKDMSIPRLMFHRFWETLTEDGRISRMLNDGLWVMINMICLFISCGVINLIGFAFDVCNEMILALMEYWRYSMVRDDLLKQIEKKANEVREINLNQEQISNLEIDPDQQARKTALLADIKHLSLAEKVLYNKLFDASSDSLIISIWNSVTWKGVRVVSGVAIIFIGMCMLYFLPTTLIGLTLMGGGCALIGGSGIYGFCARIVNLGIRLRNYIKELLKDPIEKVERVIIKVEDLVDAAINNNIFTFKNGEIVEGNHYTNNFIKEKMKEASIIDLPIEDSLGHDIRFGNNSGENNSPETILANLHLHELLKPKAKHRSFIESGEGIQNQEKPMSGRRSPLKESTPPLSEDAASLSSLSTSTSVSSGSLLNSPRSRNTNKGPQIVVTTIKPVQMQMGFGAK